MHFQVHQDAHGFDWSLEKKEGPVCKSAKRFLTEREARSDIAAAKKSFRATSRLRVLSPGEEP
jgi:hypothetical protein